MNKLIILLAFVSRGGNYCQHCLLDAPSNQGFFVKHLQMVLTPARGSASGIGKRWGFHSLAIGFGKFATGLESG
jgi:hypothetical protein